MADFDGAAQARLRDRPDDTVSARTLVFVDRAAGIGPPDPSTDIVVLDSSWTPAPGDRADVRPIRPTLQSIILSIDLFDGTLDRLDAWAEATGIADRLMFGGVTWWNRVRMIIRWDVHELTLWRHVLDRLAPPGRYAVVVIPADRTLLAAAARAGARTAGAPAVRTVGAPVRRIRQLRGWIRGHLSPSVRRRIRSGIDYVRVGPRRRRELRRRSDVLDRRLDALIAAPPDVVSIVSARAFQAIRVDGQDRFIDPNLAFALDRLAGEGCRTASVALAFDHGDDADWARMKDDDRLLPHSMIKARYAESDVDLPADDGAVIAVPRIGFDVAGTDLGREVSAIVDGFTGGWFDGQRRWTMLADRLLADLRPRAVFLDREGSRTLWMAAARRRGIPIVAAQHGVIYPNNPEYSHRPHRGVLLPDVTCVFGTYERDVLLEHGLFTPESVVVTGFGRADPEAVDPDSASADRAAIRAELGIADGDRLLVISVANNPVGGDIHSLCMVARMLDGPLPGVHVVVKLHPIDRVGGRYETLVQGMARAGGYAATPLTMVREIDLYRLLRAADAHLGQYSTVLTDAVVAGTPNMIAVGAAFNDHIGYEAARVATPVRTVDDVRAFMADPGPPDPDDRARFLAAHFRPGDATGRIATAVREAMLPVVVEARA